jgi:DNA-binding transcriptional MocR family regulator
MPKLMPLTWLPNLDQVRGPLYWRIHAALANDIRAGRLAAGERLPPHRTLARTLGVTVNTVSRAFAEAERSGLVVSRVGRGTYVKGFPEDLVGVNDGPLEIVDLSVNVASSDSFNPVLNRLLGALSRRRSLHALLHYCPYPGVARHRSAAARWIARRGIEARPGQVVVCNGAQEGLLTSLSAIARPRDTIVTEKLNYAGVRHIARSLDLNLRGVECDAQGMLPDALEVACHQENVAAILVTPTNHNPTNASMPLTRRAAIVEIAGRAGTLLIEDDAFGHLSGDATPTVTSLAPERCIYVCSLSKSVAVGLRVGFILAPAALVASLVNALRVTTSPYPAFMAELMTLLVEDGSADGVVAWHRSEAQARLDMARQILPLDSCGPSALPSYHLWVSLPGPWRPVELTEELRARGVLVSPSDNFAVDRSPTPRAVRLSLGAPSERDQLRRALGIIAERLREPPPRLHNLPYS